RAGDRDGRLAADPVGRGIENAQARRSVVEHEIGRQRFAAQQRAGRRNLRRPGVRYDLVGLAQVCAPWVDAPGTHRLNAPFPPKTLARRAEQLIDAGRPAEALALADAAIQSAGLPEGFAARARALRALGEADGALAALDALIGCAPGSAPAHDARAVLLAEAGRLSEARAAFELALGLDPRLARAHFGLAALGGTTPARRAAMEALAADATPLDLGQRLFLLYALVKA